ncbi:hypothetical protein [Mariprofundus micogutta]|uniref:hypothetical protein n=1 Tax=Mariprofundus micogutta TaxID=1921010 RepID=UPI0011601028|nr:hypothetical protein [Mariprofundus micogutta]
MQVLAGQTSKLVIGDVMKGMVQKTEQPGSFRVVLNDEPFTIKGLPTPLAGKETSFIAQKLAGGKVELAWLGQAKTITATHQQLQTNITTDKSTTQAKAGSLLSGKVKTVQTTLLSALPDAVKSGKNISARIDSIQAGKMTMTLIQADSKAAEKIAAAKQDSTATRQQIITSPDTGLKTGQQTAASRQQIITSASMGLKAGQQVSINITGETSSGKAIVEITPQQHTQASAKTAKADLQQSTLGKLNLAVGDSALALVQKRLANGNIQINIKGVSLETPAPAQVKTGDALEIKLMKPPAEFQVVQLHKNVSQKALSLVRQNLANSQTPVAQNLTTIRSVLPNTDSSTFPDLKGLPQLETFLKSTESSRAYPINGDRLAQLIRDSGGNLESKLHSLINRGEQAQSLQQDLKAILLQVSGDQNTGKTQHAEVLRLITELSQQSAGRIELGQALNVLANIQGEASRIEFPMLVGQQLINVQLAVQENGQQTNHSSSDGSGDQSFSVLFALELSGLGAMRIDANISDKSVYARLYNDDSDACGFIQQHIGKLEERLQNLGYDKVHLSASANKIEPEKQLRFDELTSMRPTSFSLLDLLV